VKQAGKGIRKSVMQVSQVFIGKMRKVFRMMQERYSQAYSYYYDADHYTSPEDDAD
jgi:ribosomal protein L20